MRQLTIQDRITDRTVGIERYFNDVENASSLLSADEEYKLALRIREGDREAYDKLVKANLRFVISVAKQYSRGGDSLSELIAQGNVGLLEAAEKFDPSRGFKFISFAVWFIRKEILFYLNQCTKTVRVPQSIILDMSRIKKAEVKLSTELGRDPLPEEIVEAVIQMGWPMTLQKFEKTREAERNHPTPLETSNPDDEWSPISWLDSGDKTSSLAESNDGLKYVNEVLSELTELDRELVILRLGLNDGDSMSFPSIGQRYGKSSEWARQNYDKAISKVKKTVRRKHNTKKYEI